MEILWAFLLLGGLGLVFGIILAVCAKVLYVKVDTRVDDIKEMLPNYNCGSCGYAGCAGFADAIVKGEVKNLSRCKPGKPETNFNKIKEYLENNPNEDGSVIKVDI